MTKLTATPYGDPPGSVQFEATAKVKGDRLDLRQGKWALSLPLPPKKGREAAYKVPRGEFAATANAWLGEDGETLCVDLSGGWPDSFDVPASEVEGDLAPLKREIARSEKFATESQALVDQHMEKIRTLHARYGI